MNLVEVRNLFFKQARGEKSFSLRVPRFELKKGETLFLRGPSGCGKSTFLELLAGLLKPTEGEILFEGTQLSAQSGPQVDKLRGQDMGFIFQNFNLIPYLRVLENILLPMQLHPELIKRFLKTKDHSQSTTEMTDCARSSLKVLGLEDYLNHFSSELSVGQQQRVAAARALIHQPKLILADEPTSALDHDNTEILLSYLLDQVKKSGAGLILVSHDSALASRFDRVIEMKDLVTNKDSDQRSCEQGSSL